MKRGVTLLFLLCGACASEERATRANVVVDVDPGIAVPAEIARIEVTVEPVQGAGMIGRASAELDESGRRPPVTFPVRYVGEGPARFLARVRGISPSGEIVIEHRAHIVFVPGETVTVRVLLEAACSRRTCPEETTCRSGTCEPIEGEGRDASVEIRDAGVSDGWSPPGDASSPPDAWSQPDASSPPDAWSQPDVGAPRPDASCGSISCGSACDCDDCGCTLICSEGDDCDSIRCRNGAICDVSARRASNVELDCDRATCLVDATGASNVLGSRCRHGARCELDCTSVSNCDLSCEDGSSCLLRCRDASTCALVCHSPRTDCGGDVWVCGRACP